MQTGILQNALCKRVAKSENCKMWTSHVGIELLPFYVNKFINFIDLTAILIRAVFPIKESIQ